MDPAGFAKYIDFMIADAGEAELALVPTSLCTAVLSLIEYLNEARPSGPRTGGRDAVFLSCLSSFFGTSTVFAP